jgi:hypothetical protein
MKDAAIAPPGVTPSQQPMAEDRSSVTQYFGRSFHTLRTTLRLIDAAWPRNAKPLFHRQHDLADAEQADHGHQKVDAAEQLAPAEGHAQLAGNRIHADAGEQQAKRHGDDRLVLFLAPEADKRAECEQINREELRRAEAQGKVGDARREEL